MKPTRRSFLKWLTAAPVVAPVAVKAITEELPEESGDFGFAHVKIEGGTYEPWSNNVPYTKGDAVFSHDTDSYAYATGPSVQSKLHEIFQEEYKDYD